MGVWRVFGNCLEGVWWLSDRGTGSYTGSVVPFAKKPGGRESVLIS